jgi:hypothetical protein
MTQTRIPEDKSKPRTRHEELHPTLIIELAGIVEEAEKTNEPETSNISPWFYSVPCARVRHYT